MNRFASSTSLVGTRATSVRHQVLAWVCSLSVITYLDRVCMAGSAPYMTSDLSLTPSQMGAVFTAFGVAYAIFEVPSGWLGDMIGARKVLTRIVVWWSAFTALTGAARGFWSLFIVRFMFGAGEAGAYPNTAKVISRWMAPHARGFAQGIVWTLARLSGAFAPFLTVYLIHHIGWRLTFWVFGGVGIVWAALFWWWFRDTPQEKASVNEAELRIIQGNQPGAEAAAREGHLRSPWRSLLRSGNLWTICWMYFCLAYPWYFYITWLPTFLKESGLPIERASLYGGGPLFFGAMGCVVGGWLTDYVVKRTGNLKNRSYIGCAGFALGALCLYASTHVADPTAAVVVISLSSFFGDLTLASCWAVCLDIGHELAGTVSACMNTWGNLGGSLSPLVTGFLVQHYGNWSLPITLSAGVFFLGALLWLRIDPTKPLLGPRG